MKKIHAFALLALLLCGCNENKKTLHVYTWVDYISPDIVSRFEEKYDCKVIIDTFDSNEAAFAKLKSGATGYDILVPTSYQVEALIKHNLIQPLDTNRLISISQSFDYKYVDKVYSPVFSYTVPYAISYGCLFYSTNEVNAADVASWSVLGNSKYKGRISVLDDIRETLGVGLFMNGCSLNSDKQADLNAAVGFIQKIRPNIRKFDNESYKTEVPNGSTLIGHGYSGDALQVILGDDETPGRDDLAIAFPKEGFTVSCDELVIMKDAKEVELAYAFINFIYEAENCKENMEYILALTPNVAAEELLGEKLKKLLALDEETLRRGQVTLSLDNKPEVMEMYNKAWDDAKSTEK